MIRLWNAFVCRAWYAFGCPPRFPLRRIPVHVQINTDPAHIIDCPDDCTTDHGFGGVAPA